MTQEEFDNLKIGDIINGKSCGKHVIVDIKRKGWYIVDSLEGYDRGNATYADTWTLVKKTNIIRLGGKHEKGT